MPATDRPFLSSAHIKLLLGLQTATVDRDAGRPGWEGGNGGREEKEGFMAACKFVHQSFRSYQLHLLSLGSVMSRLDSTPN